MVDSMYSLPALEHSLVVYISTEEFSQPFDLSSVPVISKEESDAQALRAKTEIAALPTIAAEKPKTTAQTVVPSESVAQKYAKTLSEVPEFKEFGAVLKSSLKPVELTEKETEYAVSAIKHIFQEHIVLQVHCFDVRTDSSSTYRIPYRIPF
jgi:coatomer subunit gamma